MNDTTAANRSAIFAALLEAAKHVLCYEFVTGKPKPGPEPSEEEILTQARRIAAFCEVREWRENLDDRDMVEIVLGGLPPFDLDEWLDLQAQLCDEGCELTDILLKIEEA